MGYELWAMGYGLWVMGYGLVVRGKGLGLRVMATFRIKTSSRSVWSV